MERTNFILMVLVLTVVFTAGCVQPEQKIPEECLDPRVSDSECISKMSSPTPTESAIVVKGAEVTATPEETEEMPTTACNTKSTWKKEHLGSIRVNAALPQEKKYDNGTTICGDGILVFRATVQTTGEIDLLAHNTGNKPINIYMEVTQVNLTPEEKLSYPNGRGYTANFALRPDAVVDTFVLPSPVNEFELRAEYKFQAT